MPSVSIKEVAKLAGVSRATVSRVLNGNTESLVTAETRARVRQAAEHLGYHPSAVARGLAGKPMNTLGVVLAYILPSVTTDPYLGPVLDGILNTDKRYKQKTVLFTENDWDEAYANLKVYCDGHCDGLILIIPRTDSQLVPALKKCPLPYVLVGDSREDPEISLVDIDNVAIAQQAVEYVIQQGHQRIAIFCGNRELASNGQRLEGYRRAHQAAQLPIDEALILPGEYWEWSGHENAERVVAMPAAVRPTALFCSNGRIAVGAMRALKERNVAVPETISVVAVVEGSEQTNTIPALTAVQMPLRQIGEYAVESLLAQIHHGSPPGSKKLLPGELVVRDSVLPLKQ